MGTRSLIKIVHSVLIPKPSNVVFLAVLIVLSGCAPRAVSEPKSPTPARQEDQETPQQPKRVYSSDTRTGINEVDDVIKYVNSGDVRALSALLTFTQVPCSKEIPSFTPECTENQPVGTLLDAFVYAQCQGGWAIEKEFIQARFRRNLASQRFIFAVYRTDKEIHGEVRAVYGVVLINSDKDTQALQLLLDASGRIRGLVQCGGIERFDQNFNYILPPKS